MNESIEIIKSDGSKEPFQEKKLRESLRKAEAPDDVINSVVDHIVEKELRPGLETSAIYNHAFSLLKQYGGATAARYSLRSSLADLGPTGYPFENFVGELFNAQDYAVETGVKVAGHCTTHEVDVIGQSDSNFVIGEVKFHNKPNIKSDVKTALYIKARFDDLEKNNFDGTNPDELEPTKFLITNTKFTSRAIQYGECAGLKLIGWNYPVNGNLQNLIDEANLQPVTTLTTLSDNDKKELIDNEMVLCKDLRKNRDALKKVGISDERMDAIMKEVDGLCHL